MRLIKLGLAGALLVMLALSGQSALRPTAIHAQAAGAANCQQPAAGYIVGQNFQCTESLGLGATSARVVLTNAPTGFDLSNLVATDVHGSCNPTPANSITKIDSTLACTNAGAGNYFTGMIENIHIDASVQPGTVLTEGISCVPVAGTATTDAGSCGVGDGGSTTPAAVQAISSLSGQPVTAGGGAPSGNSSSPAPRRFANLVYDAATNSSVLFGGCCDIAGNAFSETWSWDGANWTPQLPMSSPYARQSASMAYDAAHGQVVLFGGLACCINPVQINDTWVWDGTNWTMMTPVDLSGAGGGPPPRQDAAMAYDTATGNVVLFGGRGANGTSLDDTWTWDGSAWTQQTPAASPPALERASMAYDDATGTLVLFGGTSCDSNGCTAQGNTWSWDGTTWTEVATAGPSPRNYAAMAFDSTTGTLVLFGGCCDPATSRGLDDTWTWDGTTWTQQTPASGPAGRYGAGMTFDATNGVVVLYGGTDGLTTLNDTWTWDGSTWTQQAPAP